MAAAVFLVLFVALAPARLLGFLVPADQLTLSGYTGTLWRGSASRATVAMPGGWMHLGRVQWQLRPWSLLLLSPRVNVDARWGSQLARGDVIVRGGEAFGFRAFEVLVDAALIRQLAPLALDGMLRAEFEHLEIDAGSPLSASGRAVWQGAAWLSPAGRKLLGDYALTLEQADGQALAGEVITLAGPVTAAGRVELDGRAFAIDLDIGSEGAMDPGLQQALSLMAQPVSSGYKLVLNGEL